MSTNSWPRSGAPLKKIGMRMGADITKPLEGKEAEDFIQTIEKSQADATHRHFFWAVYSPNKAPKFYSEMPCFGRYTYSIARAKDVMTYVHMNYRRGLNGVYRNFSEEDDKYVEEVFNFFLDPETSPYHAILPYVHVVRSSEGKVQGLIHTNLQTSWILFVNLCIACRSHFTHPQHFAAMRTYSLLSDATIAEACLAASLVAITDKKIAHLFNILGAKDGWPVLTRDVSSVSGYDATFVNWLTGNPRLPKTIQTVPNNFIWADDGNSHWTAMPMSKDARKFYNFPMDGPTLPNITRNGNSPGVGAAVPIFPTSSDDWSLYTAPAKQNAWHIPRWSPDKRWNGFSEKNAQRIIDRIREIARGEEPTTNFGIEFD